MADPIKTTLMEDLEEEEDQTVPVGEEVVAVVTLAVPVDPVQILAVGVEVRSTLVPIRLTSQEQTLALDMFL